MLKLGKLAPKLNSKTLLFSKYIDDTVLPKPAKKVYREYKTPEEAKLMYGNDQYGDCTCAGAANLLILATCHTGKVVIPTLTDVLDMYTAISGFDLITGANDNGAAMTDALNHLRTVGLSGHKILAWAKINHKNLQHRKIACDLFGATYVGVQLPGQAQSQFENRQSWEVVENDTNEGGHAIIRTGYGALGDNYVTWGKWDQKASAAWSLAYVEEEYVVITQDWFNSVTKLTPGGLDLATLESDLKLL